MTHGKSRSRYFVTRPGVPEQEVSFEAWCKAERAAGFHAPEGHAATGGFSGYGISGRVEFERIADTGLLAQPRSTVTYELELRGSINLEDTALADAIDAASDQDRTTWLIRGRRRIAAIVPVGVAERGRRS